MLEFLGRWFGRKQAQGALTPLETYLELVESDKSRVRDIADLPAAKDELKRMLAHAIGKAGESERERMKKAYLLLADFQEAARELDARDAMINEVRGLMTELKVIEGGSAVH